MLTTSTYIVRYLPTIRLRCNVQHISSSITSNFGPKANSDRSEPKSHRDATKGVEGRKKQTSTKKSGVTQAAETTAAAAAAEGDTKEGTRNWKSMIDDAKPDLRCDLDRQSSKTDLVNTAAE